MSRRDPHPENVNLKTCGATVPDKTAHSAATSHVQWGRWGFLPRKARSCGADGGGSAFSSSQRECVLTVANEVQLSTRRVHSATQRKRALYFSFTLLKQLASKKRPDLSRSCKQKATRSASVTDDQSALSSDEKYCALSFYAQI